MNTVATPFLAGFMPGYFYIWHTLVSIYALDLIRLIIVYFTIIESKFASDISIVVVSGKKNSLFSV